MELTSTRLAPPRRTGLNIDVVAGHASAHYILDVPSRTYGKENKRLWVANQHPKFLSRLIGQGSVVQALVSPTSTGQTDARMSKGVDLYANPGWRQEIVEFLPYADRLQGYEYVFWVYVPLGRVVSRKVLGMGGDGDLKKIVEKEDKFFKSIPQGFGPMRATEAQVEWFHAHKTCLGVLQQMITVPSPTADVGRVRRPNLAFDEGNQAEREKFGPSMEPVVRIHDRDHPERAYSYQTTLLVDEFPPGGLDFFASQFTNVLEDLATPAVVEWAMRLKWDTKQKARQDNKNERGKIASQREMRAADPKLAGVELDEAEDELYEIEAELSYGDEALLDYSVLITIGAGSAEVAAEAVREVRDRLADLDFVLAAPIGKQGQLWGSTKPSRADTSTADGFNHRTTRRLWGMFTPLLTTRVGESWGIPLAVTRGSRRNTLVYVRPDERTAFGPSIMIWSGKSGGGKTKSMMRTTFCTVLRGGSALVDDLTAQHQWEGLADNMPDANKFTFQNYRLDPILCYPQTPEGQDKAYDLLVESLGLDPLGLAAAQLSLAMALENRAHTGVWSLRGLLDYTRRPDCPAELAEVGQVLAGWAARAYARCLFDESLPTLDLSVGRMWVFRTSALDLPTRPAPGDTTSPHPSPAQLMSMKLYSLLWGLAEDEAWRRPEFTAVVSEEAGHGQDSPVVGRMQEKIATKGRAANVGFYGASQNLTRDFPKKVHEAKPFLVITAHGSKQGALDTLRTAEYDGPHLDAWSDELVWNTSPDDEDAPGSRLYLPSDDAIADRVLRRGEALIRDTKDTWQWVQLLDFSNERLRAATDTTPELFRA